MRTHAWARAEFQANQYPENRIFQAVFHRICELVPPGSAILFVREKAGWFTPGRVRREDCPACQGHQPERMIFATPHVPRNNTQCHE